MRIEKMNFRRVAEILLILLILATVVFIFVQSMLPPEKSAEQSGAVGEIIEEIIPPETEAGDYVQKNLRKIAHFVEFFILGAEVSLYVIFFMPKTKFALMTFPSALILAFFDESIQILSKRGPAILDVWIDFSGFVSASLITYAIFSIIAFIYKKCKQK